MEMPLFLTANPNWHSTILTALCQTTLPSDAGVPLEEDQGKEAKEAKWLQVTMCDAA